MHIVSSRITSECLGSTIAMPATPGKVSNAFGAVGRGVLGDRPQLADYGR